MKKTYGFGQCQGKRGERVIKDLGGGNITHYVFDLSGTLIAEADGSGATQREYILIDGLPLGIVVGTTLYYVHPDHLGAPQKITDGAKTIVWDGQFTPFGQVHSVTGALVANWRMPGQYHDAEAQLSYNYRRTYDPTLGRYLQSDPIGLAGGFNTYAYAGGNPAMLTDPTGEIAPLVVAAVEAAPLIAEAVEAVGAIALRVAVTISGRTAVGWLTPQYLARISTLWAVLGITWSVIDVKEFGFTVPDRDSSAGDISADPLGQMSRTLPSVYPTAALIIVLSQNDSSDEDNPADQKKWDLAKLRNYKKVELM